MVGAIFEGVGVSSGSFLCGYLMKVYSGRIAFRIFGVSAICLSFLHYFVQKFLDNFDTKHGKTLQITHTMPNGTMHINGELGLNDKSFNNAERFTMRSDS